MSNMSKGKTMKVYGITGSIACGKSTVTHYLIERGYLVVDADLISRRFKSYLDVLKMELLIERH